MKPGKSLETLIAYLERHLAPGTVLVESPKRIRDKTTGKLREHDVVLTVISGHHRILVAVECRDRSRPVGVPQIEGFAKKCSETLIDKGVIVSPRGFTTTALSKSKALGIRCLSLDQVNTFPWIFSDTKFHQIHVTYKPLELTMIPEEDFPTKPTSFKIVNNLNEVISVDALRDSIFSAIRAREKYQPNSEIGEKVEKLSFNMPNLTIIDEATGTARNLKRIQVVATSETTIVEIPFVMHEYKDPASKTSISQIAVASMDCGPLKGRFVINNKLDTGGEIVFIPDAGGTSNKGRKDNSNRKAMNKLTSGHRVSEENE